MNQYEDLIEQRRRLEDAPAQLERGITTLSQEQERLEHELDGALLASMRTGDDGNERDIRARLTAIDLELSRMRRQLQLNQAERTRIDIEIAAAEKKIMQGFRAKAAEKAGAILAKLHSDKHLQAAILESACLCIAAEHALGPATGYFDWGNHVADMFRPPSDDEYSAAMKKAKASLGIA